MTVTNFWPRCGSWAAGAQTALDRSATRAASPACVEPDQYFAGNRARTFAIASDKGDDMQSLFKEIRHNPLLWMLAVVPIVLVAEKAAPEAHTLLFVLAVLAIVPLAALLSHATEAVAAKTGDAVGGLLNATLG